VTCARLFKFKVLAGQARAYAAYLREVVEPIDAAAHEAGVFDRLHTVTPDTRAGWNHGRIFIFLDRAQRDAFAARMAEHASDFDGSAEATAVRKAYAETLRSLISISDFEII
jgi:hypothetical protein